ncbi:peptidase domain-containing ABC transporter [Novosphingobium ginsenosidimutans]|uniref:Peptidase domain-containing ABC transporter n=2 Tax=Novosphingobium ginsenosidimutans TaxID=1176536 RepID=A0A5B8S3B6_9SPHN|nr:peptidase domain-containing ABC transporter [Novosphingobium ginsenosidimutans]
MMQGPEFLNLTGARRTPYIAQSEAAECGLACIAMVAAFHGYETDLGTLRQRFSFSLKGATLKQLMEVAEAIGFNSRPLRGEIDDLAEVQLPAVLHWDLNHFVVLTKVSKGFGGERYHIHDPGRGALVVGREELSRRFTGIVLELLKSETFRPVIEQNKLKITQLWTSMNGLWPSLRQIFLLSLVLQLAALAAPFYMQIAIDTVFPSFDAGLLKVLALGFAGLALIQFATSWTRSLVLLTLNNALSYQVIVNLFRHLVRLPLPWFEKRHVGDIISRFGSTQPITAQLSQGLIASLIDGIMALITLSLMFVYAPVLSLLAIGALLAYIGLRLAFLQAMKLRNVNVITANAQENSTFIETIRGIAAIKAFGQEGNRQRLWQKKKAEAVNANIKLGRLTAGFDAGNQLVVGLENVLFVYLAIGMAFDAKITVGMLFAYQAYKRQFLDAGIRLVEQAINYNLLQVHLSRISDIALSKPENLAITHTGYDDTGQRHIPSIELRNVRFSYGVGEPEILKGINLRIEPGESVALVGPSGGGKTTLMKIMMGLLKPTYGEVLIDGQPLEAYGLARWRAQIGSVAQDDQLFAGTIAENIAFFDPEPDMARIEEAARTACIADDIDRLPMRYQTLVGDMGSVFSGGQKQRILLARAVYGQPTTLFFDEGTSHLDNQKQDEVLAAIHGLDVSAVMVAHRSSALAQCNRAITVFDGIVGKELLLEGAATNEGNDL